MDVRIAHRNDLQQLQILHNRYLAENIQEENKANGFLTCDPFTELDFYLMIDEKEVVVAVENEVIVGYYLFDNFSRTKSLKLFKNLINDLQKKGKLINLKISCRAQAVIDVNYQNKGLSKLMLSKLIEVTRENYDVLFSIVYKNNPKLVAHQKAGWSILDEDQEKYFVTYQLSK